MGANVGEDHIHVAAPPLILCLVVGVADGDALTARCDAPDGRVTIQVRLAEIYAPEKDSRSANGQSSTLRPCALGSLQSFARRPVTAMDAPSDRPLTARYVGHLTARGFASSRGSDMGTSWSARRSESSSQFLVCAMGIEQPPRAPGNDSNEAEVRSRA